jgi:hypothetical protein
MESTLALNAKMEIRVAKNQTQSGDPVDDAKI